MKKGNKPFADDLAQLRANPDEFQSDEAGLSGFKGLGCRVKGLGFRG